jgi:streptomycin 6-kinase
VQVPALVASKARELGEPGLRWLDALPAHLAQATRRWSLTIGDPLPGGSAAYVVRVQAADGTPAVLKLALPDGGFAAQVAVLSAAGGRGYVRLLAHSDGALLLEELGPALDLPVEAALDVLAPLLHTAWEVEADVPAVPKAARLAAFVHGLRHLGPDDVVARAVALAERRAADPGPPVVVHGDPHPGNVLARALARGGGYVFVDPEGFRTEAAYDVGVVLRDRCPELLAGDAPALLRRWCARMAAATGTDADAVWEWAFVERVSTGLYLRSLGADGSAFLDVAAQLG